jgi:aminoglycoside/choline kinase family phosphotransferase
MTSKIITSFLNTPHIFQALTPDASSRMYYRSSQFPDALLCFYPKDMQSSLERVLAWSEVYARAGILVPEVLCVNKEEGILVQKDLGDYSLQHLYGQCRSDLTNNYLEKAFEYMWRIQGMSSPSEVQLVSMNASKYEFELRHTEKYYLSFMQGYHEEVGSEILKLWQGLLAPVDAEKKYLAHRDYHCRNLMINNDELYVIDFQDTLLAHPTYDLCSLLHDCYTEHEPSHIQSALRAAHAHLGKGSYPEFFDLYQRSKAQRLYKAIGSFSYMYEVKKNPRYLKYIGHAQERLKFTLDLIEGSSAQTLKNRLMGLYYAN